MLKPSSMFSLPGKTGKNVFKVFHYVQQVFQETFSCNKILFTPLEKATDSCRWYRSFLIGGGSMPPSIVVREHSSLTGVTSLFVFTGASTRNINLAQSNKKPQETYNPFIFTKLVRIKFIDNGNNGTINKRYG